MQNQTPTTQDFSIEKIQNVVDKILIELQSIPQSQYSEILKLKYSKFKLDFNNKTHRFIQSHLKQPYKLNFLCKSDESKIQNLADNGPQPQKSAKVSLLPPNIFLYSFQLPCRYSNYQEMIVNPKIQTKLDDKINSYEIQQEILRTSKIRVEKVELSYKRVMIISPRQFVYLRIFFNENEKINWILTFSVPYEKKSDKTTGQIILTAQKIQEDLEGKKIRIQVYSEIDMKSAVKPDIARNVGLTEIKKYVQKLYEHSKTL